MAKAKTTKKRPPYNQEAAIRGALRRAFSRSPIVKEVMDASRREVPRYTKDGSRHKKNWVQSQCQVCDQWHSKSKMAVDHIVPVISVENGKQSWDKFIDRLWCAKENLQRICDTCHDKKTYEERIARLLIKYNTELDEIELAMRGQVLSKKSTITVTFGFFEIGKLLSKYTAKKKTPEFGIIVERALRLKTNLK